MRGNNPMFWLKLHVSVNISVNSWWNYHKPPQTMTWTTTNDDMNHHKSQITTNHHKPWHKPPWTMTETSTKHDMNHYKSPQTMTWTIMMTQKELCIKPYGFLVCAFTLNPATTGTTSWNGRKTLGFYQLIWFVIWTPYFKLWNVRNCIVFCGGAWPFRQPWRLVIVVIIGLFFGCFHSCMGVFLSSLPCGSVGCAQLLFL